MAGVAVPSGFVSGPELVPSNTSSGVLVTRDHATRAERLRRPSILQRQFDALAVDETVAASYGQLAAAVTDIRRQPRARALDLLIAATAHAHSARLYTRNAKERRVRPLLVRRARGEDVLLGVVDEAGHVIP